MWDLLDSLPTCPFLQEQVTKLIDIDTSINWEDFFNTSSLSRLYYILRIVEGLVLPLVKQDEALRSLWCTKFVSRGGFSHLLKMVATEHLGDLGKSGNSILEKSCLTSILRLVSFFCDCIWHAHDSDVPISAPTELVSDLASTMDVLHLFDISVNIIWSISYKIRFDQIDGDLVCYAMKLSAFCLSTHLGSMLPHFFTESLSANLKQALLTCEDDSVKREIADGFIRLCSELNGAIDEKLFEQLWSLLPSHMASEPKYFTTCRHFFRLLCHLLHSLVKHLDNPPPKYNSYAETLSNQLYERPILEVDKTVTDEILVGLMNCLKILASKSEVKMNLVKLWQQHGGNLIPDMYNSLFALKNSSSSVLPKCKSYRSRLSAFLLLGELCSENSTNHMELLKLFSKHHSEHAKTLWLGLSPLF